GVLLGHEQVLHPEVATAGATQAGDVPVVDYLDFCGRNDQEPDVGCTVRVASGCIAVVHDRVADCPMTVRDKAAVAPAAADAKAAGDDNGLSGRVDAAGEPADVGEDLTPGPVPDRAGEPGPYRSHHRAPADRTVGTRQFLDNLQKPGEIEFRSAERVAAPQPD